MRRPGHRLRAMGRRRIPSPWGEITRLPSGQYRLRGRIEGARKSLGVYATLDEAAAVAEAMRLELAGADQGLTLAAWGETWLDRRELDGRHRSVRTMRARWRRHVEPSWLARKLVRDITARHVRQWVSDLEGAKAATGKGRGEPLSGGSIRNALRVLSQAMDGAVIAGHRAQNPCLGIRVRELARTSRPWTYMAPAEIAQLLGHPKLPQYQRAVYTVAIYTGLRAGELWSLHWHDVHEADAAPSLHVRYGSTRPLAPPKSGRVRDVPLLPPASRALAEWRHRGGADHRFGLVFPGERGQGGHASGYDAGWAERRSGHAPAPGWREVCGIRADVRLHDMRHTCAAHLVSGTWGRAWRLEEVQRVLGHASRVTTERYAHLAPGGLASAAASAIAEWRE